MFGRAEKRASHGVRADILSALPPSHVESVALRVERKFFDLKVDDSLSRSLFVLQDKQADTSTT